MDKSVIYTAIFGGYDKLIDPVVHSGEIDYVCFTNNTDVASDIWQIQVVDPPLLKDMIRSARLHKICPHRFLGQYEYSLYIDGNMRLNRVPDIAAMLNGKMMALERHRKRKCLYVEAEICKKRKLDNDRTIDLQTHTYKKQKFPENAGLYASYMIARKHNDKQLIDLSETWWNHVHVYSRRDQISLPFILNNYPVEVIQANTRSKIATIKKHTYGR